jgi:hypothetical protein
MKQQVTRVRTTQHGFPQHFEALYLDSFCTCDPYRAAFMVYCGLVFSRKGEAKRNDGEWRDEAHIRGDR